MIKKIIIIVLIVAIIGVAAYFYGQKIVDNIDYDYKITSVVPKSISFKKDTVLTIGISVVIKNKNTFSVPINYLYYEVYYKGKLLGQSQPSGNIKIAANSDTTFPQMIDFHINDTATDLVSNILTGKPNDYTINAYVKIGFLKFKLNNIKITY